MGAFVGAVAQSHLMGGLAFLVLSLAAWRLWVPVTFDLSSKGILQRTLGSQRWIPWRYVARFECHRSGVLLLADSEKSLLSPLRSVFIKWNGQKQEIQRVVTYYLDRTSQPAGSTTEPFATGD
jgi:hypothetical protein